MSEERKQVVQGDLLFTPISAAAYDDLHLGRRYRQAVVEGKRVHVLAVGEQTGHLHVLPLEARVDEAYTGATLVFVPEGLALQVQHVGGQPGDVHHKPLDLAPGAWLVSEQREHDPRVGPTRRARYD